MLLLGYELYTRRSELVALTNNDLQSLPNETMRVIITRSKADPLGQGRVVRALIDSLAWRGPNISLLFVPIYWSRVVDRELQALQL